MASFTSGGLNIAYDDIAPEGPAQGTVLMVHGFATNRSENWRRLGWYGAFERKNYRLIALDLRGHGESDKPHDPDAYGGPNMQGDIVALMDHLDLGSVNLMGYSMGAHLSVRVALAEPGRIDNLIVGGVGGSMLPGVPRPADSPSADAMADAMLSDDPHAIDIPAARGFRLFAENQGEDVRALAACMRRMGGVEANADFRSLAVPTLVVAGARDQFSGDPQDLADAIPGAKAVSLPGCDHFSAIPHALFKAAVFDFLEGWLE